jgi:glycosyltransferase involved in cell wall biosynthesis
VKSSVSQKLPVSVIVPVKNEEANIKACLESLSWADEILVVDSNSTDRTANIAESMGATVIQFIYEGRLPKKKNWALENLSFRHEWIFIIDADERVTGELRDEIGEMIQTSEFAGYYINRKFIFLGRWIKHCGWYPNWNMRLFKHQLGRYEFLGEGTSDVRTGDNEVHEHVILRGRAGYSKHHLLHEDYRDLYHWIERHNRYSSWESRVYGNLRERKGTSSIDVSLLGEPLERRRFFKRIWVYLPFKPFLKFFAMYVLKLGFLDGKAGYYFCRLHSHHEFNIKAKQFERRLREQESLAHEANLKSIEDAFRSG